MRTSQNARSVFYGFSSAKKPVDNVHNSVYKSLFPILSRFLMWITHFLLTIIFIRFSVLDFIFVKSAQVNKVNGTLVTKIIF